MLLQDVIVRISPSEDMSILLQGVSDATVWRSEMHRSKRFIFARVSFLLPGAARGGVYSGFESLGQDDSRLNLWWGGVDFRFSGGGGGVCLGFSTAWSPALFRSSGDFSSWALATVSVYLVRKIGAWSSEVHTRGACVHVEDEQVLAMSFSLES